jgi:bacteriorhodopsin
MAMASLLFLYQQLSAKEERSRLVFVIAFFCTAISCFSYFAMASGYGVFVTASGGLVFWARYVDWMITTPLSLVIISLVAQAKFEETFFVVLTDVLMVLCWLCFAVVAAPFKYVWWSAGSLLFLVVALRLNAVAQDSEARIGPAAHDVLKTLTLIITAMWLGYPVMILLGADGVGAVPTKAELGCLTLLDLSAKVSLFIIRIMNVYFT